MARHRRLSTFGDGVAMSLAAGGGALVGMASWILAARALTPAELGIAAAFVSAVLLIGGSTELSLGVGLMRWLPAAGPARRTIALRAAAAVTVLAGLVALAYVWLPGASLVVDAAAGAGGDRVRATGIFVLMAMLYALFQQQDYALVGLGRAWWAPGRVGMVAVVRLGILVASGAALTTNDVVWAWLLPTAAAVVLGAVVVERALRAAGAHEDRPWRTPDRREVVGFLGPTYLGRIATALLHQQVPLVVTFRFGPDVGASFFLVWQAITVIDVVAMYFVAPLSTGIAREPERADELSRATRRRLVLLLAPVTTLAALVAGPVLGLFGATYRAAAPVLALMLAGSVFRLLVIHRLGEHQARGRSVRFARLTVVNTVLVLGVALFAPSVGPGVVGHLLPIAAGVVAVQALGAGVVLVRGRQESQAAVAAGPGAVSPGASASRGRARGRAAWRG